MDIAVEIDRVSRRFGEIVALDSVSLSIRRGEFFSLLGPSGCGKSTLLRLIAGLDQPDSGTIRIGGQDVTGLPPFRRPVNMVFQDYALFPHLSVEENVAFGLRYKGVPRGEQAAHAAEALALVQLKGFEQRRPHELSGGQRQRVALARALAMRPQVLLLDEPLGALDQRLREDVQVELKNLQKRLGITFVFVTHDQEESLTMSDRLAVMNRGRVEQSGPCREIFETPGTEFVARFMGAPNIFTARVRGAVEGVLSVTLPGGGDLRLADGDPGARWSAGQQVRFIVRPERLELLADSSEPVKSPVIPVIVRDRVYRGVSTSWIVEAGHGDRFLVTRQSGSRDGSGEAFEVGSRALLCWDPAHTVLLRTEG